MCDNISEDHEEVDIILFNLENWSPLLYLPAVQWALIHSCIYGCIWSVVSSCSFKVCLEKYLWKKEIGLAIICNGKLKKTMFGDHKSVASPMKKIKMKEKNERN